MFVYYFHDISSELAVESHFSPVKTRRGSMFSVM